MSNVCSRVTTMPVPNRGYDVAPFFYALNNLDLNAYDYIVKLHTKRDVDCYVNFRLFKGSEFRKACLAFCLSIDAVRRSISTLSFQSDVGMVAGSQVIDPSGYGSCRDPWKNAHQITAIGLTPLKYSMVLGTMFMVRAQILRPVWKRFSWVDFIEVDAGNAHKEYGAAIDWEGAFGMLVTAQGFRVSDGKHSMIISKMRDFVYAVLLRIIRLCTTIVRKFGSEETVDAIARSIERHKSKRRRRNERNNTNTT